jgi:hypothetical protein
MVGRFSVFIRLFPSIIQAACGDFVKNITIPVKGV